jgi:hypothetical protein
MVGLIIIGMVVVWGWITYELWRAPQLDDKGNVIKPAKTFKDLFKW